MTLQLETGKMPPICFNADPLPQTVVFFSELQQLRLARRHRKPKALVSITVFSAVDVTGRVEAKDNILLGGTNNMRMSHSPFSFCV